LNWVTWRNGQYTLAYLGALPIWWKILVPAAGGLVVGLVTYYFAREARGHGVPEVMEAVALHDGRIRPRVVLAKMFASGVCIASGGSVGREGPIVQIGSAIGSTVGQWMRVDPARLRTLVACGAAAGIAGTFNAPVAGALFAVEIILGDFAVMQFSPIVISSVAGTVVSQHFLGDFPAFSLPGYNLVHAGELFGYAVLGILAGVVAVGFIKTLYAAEDLFDRARFYMPAKAVVGGVLIGTIGLFMPHVFGVGYEAINDALSGQMFWGMMLALVAFKLLAVSITIGSGGSGGIFAPSLFLGAMLGGAFGTAMHALWPGSTAAPGAYALVGMGGVVAAATHAPITAILIIFELTGEYPVILPLMITCIIATLLATRMQQASIYTLKLLRRGVDIHGGKALNVLEDVPVAEEMRTVPLSVPVDETVVGLVARLMQQPGDTLFVVGNDGTLEGVITAEQLRPVMAEASQLGSLVIAQDVMVPLPYPPFAPDDSLADVMRQFGHHRGELPVVDDGQLVGVIWPEDVIARYNTEIFKRDMAREMVSSLEHPHRMALPVPTDGNAAIAEVPVPSDWAGRTIRDVDVRKQYGLNILVVKHRDDEGMSHTTASPPPDFTFGQGDRMVVMGPRSEVQRLGRVRI